MDMLWNLALVFAGINITLGMLLLATAWLCPGALASPRMQRLTTGRRLAPTRGNRTLVAVSTIACGGYFVLFALAFDVASLALLAVWITVLAVLLRRIRGPQAIGTGNPGA
jgi:hypothetical protein